jgi:hypothetical protein
MRLSLLRVFLGVFTIAVITVCGSLLFPGRAQQHFDKVAIVKLYSGDRLVATWDATSVGHVEGNTFVFTVGTPPRPTEVRISGTYSVETIP